MDCVADTFLDNGMEHPNLCSRAIANYCKVHTKKQMHGVGFMFCVERLEAWNVGDFF